MTLIAKDPDRLYDLLPALYRIADSLDGEKLRALLALITGEADALRDDTQQLWDDFFIETCQRWVIPYIGDLVGNSPLHDLDLRASAATAESLFTDLGSNLTPGGGIRTRADVAKTSYYRRRKGTPPMLEELARDVTGWGARLVEFFTLLDWNQHLEHVRLECQGCPDLRRVDVGDRVGGPGDTTTRGDQSVGRLVQHPEHRLISLPPPGLPADRHHAARDRRHNLASYVQPARPEHSVVLGGTP